MLMELTCDFDDWKDRPRRKRLNSARVALSRVSVANGNMEK